MKSTEINRNNSAMGRFETVSEIELAAQSSAENQHIRLTSPSSEKNIEMLGGRSEISPAKTKASQLATFAGLPHWLPNTDTLCRPLTALYQRMPKRKPFEKRCQVVFRSTRATLDPTPISEKIPLPAQQADAITLPPPDEVPKSPGIIKKLSAEAFTRLENAYHAMRPQQPNQSPSLNLAEFDLTVPETSDELRQKINCLFNVESAPESTHRQDLLLLLSDLGLQPALEEADLTDTNRYFEPLLLAQTLSAVCDENAMIARWVFQYIANHLQFNEAALATPAPADEKTIAKCAWRVAQRLSRSSEGFDTFLHFLETKKLPEEKLPESQHMTVRTLLQACDYLSQTPSEALALKPPQNPGLNGGLALQVVHAAAKQLRGEALQENDHGVLFAWEQGYREDIPNSDLYLTKEGLWAYVTDILPNTEKERNIAQRIIGLENSPFSTVARHGLHGANHQIFEKEQEIYCRALKTAAEHLAAYLHAHPSDNSSVNLENKSEMRYRHRILDCWIGLKNPKHSSEFTAAMDKQLEKHPELRISTELLEKWAREAGFLERSSEAAKTFKDALDQARAIEQVSSTQLPEPLTLEQLRQLLTEFGDTVEFGGKVLVTKGNFTGFDTRSLSWDISPNHSAHSPAFHILPRFNARLQRGEQEIMEFGRSMQGMYLVLAKDKPTGYQPQRFGGDVGGFLGVSFPKVGLPRIGANFSLSFDRELNAISGVVLRVRRHLHHDCDWYTGDDWANLRFDNPPMRRAYNTMLNFLFDQAAAAKDSNDLVSNDPDAIERGGRTGHAQNADDLWNKFAHHCRMENNDAVSVGWFDQHKYQFRSSFSAEPDVSVSLTNLKSPNTSSSNHRPVAPSSRVGMKPFSMSFDTTWPFSTTDDLFEHTGKYRTEWHRIENNTLFNLQAGASISGGLTMNGHPRWSRGVGLISIPLLAKGAGYLMKGYRTGVQLTYYDTDKLFDRACYVDVEYQTVKDFVAAIRANPAPWMEMLEDREKHTPSGKSPQQTFDNFIANIIASPRAHQRYLLRFRLRPSVARKIGHQCASAYVQRDAFNDQTVEQVREILIKQLKNPDSIVAHRASVREQCITQEKNNVPLLLTAESTYQLAGQREVFIM